MANSAGGGPSPKTRPHARPGTQPSSRPDLGPSALVYIEKVRQATRRLSVREIPPEDVREAIQAVKDVATFDIDVPTASNRREGELVKTGIKRLTLWYMRYLAGQLNAFGASVLRLGDTIAARTERLESGTDELAARVGAVEERLRRLEAGMATRGRRTNSGGRPRSEN